MFSHVFTKAGLRQSNLLSSTLGMVCLGIKLIQTEYRLVSIGVSVDLTEKPSKHAKNKVQLCMKGVTGAPKGTQKESPIWSWWPLFIWTYLNIDCGVSVLGGPFGLCRFREPDQSSRQLLTTLFIDSSTYFVGYSYVKFASSHPVNNSSNTLREHQNLALEEMGLPRDKQWAKCSEPSLLFALKHFMRVYFCRLLSAMLQLQYLANTCKSYYWDFKMFHQTQAI